MKRLTNLKHYKIDNVRSLYGRHGRSSGINPGVMWPRKEELSYLKQYETAFCPKLDDLVAENVAKKTKAAMDRENRLKEVTENYKKLPGEFEKFFKVIEQKKQERAEWLKEREQMIEDVREILGYRAKPSDPKFQEALAQKEAEDLKAKRKQRRLAEAANADPMSLVKR